LRAMLIVECKWKSMCTTLCAGWNFLFCAKPPRGSSCEILEKKIAIVLFLILLRQTTQNDKKTRAVSILLIK
jgi:hypothetical protein